MHCNLVGVSIDGGSGEPIGPDAMQVQNPIAAPILNPPGRVDSAIHLDTNSRSRVVEISEVAMKRGGMNKPHRLNTFPEDTLTARGGLAQRLGLDRKLVKYDYLWNLKYFSRPRDYLNWL